MPDFTPTTTSSATDAAASTQINWLELARFAAAGEGHEDLGRGILRLATLAAAAHREAVGMDRQDVVNRGAASVAGISGEDAR